MKIDVILFLLIFTMQQAMANNLKLGNRACVKGNVSIEVEPLANLNYKSREEILNLRENIVLKHSNLLENNYLPNDVIFGQMQDSKPWWGMLGACIYGRGQNSILGESEESRFLMNPFLLVGANPDSCLIFDPSVVDLEVTKNKDFPFLWLPSSLTYNPEQQWAQCVYDITNFNQNLQKYKHHLKDNYSIHRFGLIAYNAKDFGFNYIYVSKKQSSNIINSYDMRQPIAIEQFIHCGGSCGYPGGCNNMSPKIAAIDELSFTQLPARVAIFLYKNCPSSISQKPDLTYFIDFK